MCMRLALVAGNPTCFPLRESKSQFWTELKVMSHMPHGIIFGASVPFIKKKNILNILRNIFCVLCKKKIMRVWSNMKVSK